jgi:hypothetical protein
MDFIKRNLAVSWSTKYCGKTVQSSISLARMYNAELFILHIFDPKWLQGFKRADDHIRKRAQKRHGKIQGRAGHPH